MKVYELIELLEDCEPEKEVLIGDNNDGRYFTISTVDEISAVIINPAGYYHQLEDVIDENGDLR